LVPQPRKVTNVDYVDSLDRHPNHPANSQASSPSLGYIDPNQFDDAHEAVQWEPGVDAFVSLDDAVFTAHRLSRTHGIAVEVETWEPFWSDPDMPESQAGSITIGRGR